MVKPEQKLMATLELNVFNYCKISKVSGYGRKLKKKLLA